MKEASAAASLEDVRRAASEWLVKRHDSGEWSEQDEAEFNVWLVESAAHATAYWRLEDLWSRADRLSALRRSAPEIAPMRSSLVSRMVALLALIIVVLGGAGVTAFFITPQSGAYRTSLGGHRIVVLKDGSQIELNTNTAIRVAEREGERDVWLDRGEAYFSIKHDEGRPFVVYAGLQRITDLGTKFVVRRDSQKLKVAVVEGHVRLNASDGASHQNVAILRAGEVALATAGNLSVTSQSDNMLNEELGWRRGVLTFHHERLADAVAEFNRYNTQQLAVVDPSVGRLQIGGTFPIANVKEFADSAKEILGLSIIERGNEIIITR
jgi:transmembrane sensor